MSRELLHIYGPFSIQSFGLIIAIGLLLFTWLIQRHPKRKNLLSDEQFSAIILLGIISGIIGGRLLYIAQMYHKMPSIWSGLRIWEGGFSILGTLIAIPIALTIYLKKKNIPALPFFDIIALYSGLFQAISRIGCFFAGCCYGLATNLPWGITYTDCLSLAPTGISIHPTQLYSSIFLFCIFLFMRFFAAKKFKKPGQLITLYLALASLERFTVAFWRADREYLSGIVLNLLSIHQWLALLLCFFALSSFAFLTLKPRAQH